MDDVLTLTYGRGAGVGRGEDGVGNGVRCGGAVGRGTGVGRGEGGGGTGVMRGGGVGRGAGVNRVTVKVTCLNAVQVLKVALNIGKYVPTVVGLPDITPVFVFRVNPGGSAVEL